MSQILCEKTKKTKQKTLSYRFRAEVTKSSLHLFKVRELGGSVSICHQDELSPADHSSLQCDRTGKTRQQAKLASIWTYLGAVVKRTAVGHF